MLITFTFHICTFIETLTYSIHKYTQMHLIFISVCATWSVFSIFVLQVLKGSWWMKKQQTIRDTSSRTTTKVDINIMWWDYKHTNVFKRSLLIGTCSLNNKVPTSLTHLSSTKFEVSPIGDEDFTIEKQETHDVNWKRHYIQSTGTKITNIQSKDM